MSNFCLLGFWGFIYSLLFGWEEPPGSLQSPVPWRTDPGLGGNEGCEPEPPAALGVAIRTSAKPTVCHPAVLQSKMGIMTVLMLPLLLLAISGLLFIYQEASRLWSKSAVQNKVVVITDAISGLGKGKLASPGCVAISVHKGPGEAGWCGAHLLVGRRSQPNRALLFERPKLSCLVNDRVRIPGVANSSLVLAKHWVDCFRSVQKA